MKKVFLLIAIALITSVSYGQFGNQPEREDRISNTIGFDLKNGFFGGKKNDLGVRRNPPAFLFRGGAAINSSYWEPYLGMTIFPHIDYYSMDLMLFREFATFNLDNNLYSDNSTLAFLAGGGTHLVGIGGFPMFDADEYFNYSVFGKVRWDKPVGLPGYIEFEGGWTHRSDIKDIYGDNSKYAAWDNPSGFVKAGFYIEEILELFGYY